MSRPVQEAQKRSDERAAYKENAQREREAAKAAQDEAYDTCSDDIKHTVEQEAKRTLRAKSRIF